MAVYIHFAPYYANAFPLRPLLSILITASLLLQGFSRLLIVANYELNREQITELLCVNKNSPRAHCYGKCYLNKQLGRTDTGSVPLGSLKALLAHELFAQCLSTFSFPTGEPADRPAGFYAFRAYPAPILPVFQPPKVA